MSARQVRRFQLERDVDVSGVSGTGAVAYGAQAPDGTCVLWWTSGLESTAIYPNMATLLAIHGHGGKTRAIYIDPEAWDGAPGDLGEGDGGACGPRVGAPGERDDADDPDVASVPADADDPAPVLTRSANRAGVRSGAHQPATRAAGRPVRAPTRSA
jgi:hypothetical protein